MQCLYHISMSTSTLTFPSACVISGTHLISPKPLVNSLVWEASSKFWVNKKKKKKPPPSLGSKDPRCLKPISQLQAFHTLMTSRHIFMDTHASNQKCIQRSFRKKKNQHEKKTMGSLFVEYQKTGDHQTFLKEKLASSSFQMLSYGLLLLFSQLCWIQDANTSRAVGENTHNLLDVFSTWKVRGQNESNLSRGRCRGEVRHCSNDLLTLWWLRTIANVW